MDEPRLDPVSRKWLSRLWKSRVAIVEAHKRETERKGQLVAEKGTVPVGTIVAVRLSPRELEQYPAKFAPTFNGPWAIVERFQNDSTYRVQDPRSGAVTRVTRDQFKVLDLPPQAEAGPGLPSLVVDQPAPTLRARVESVDPPPGPQGPDLPQEEEPSAHNCEPSTDPRLIENARRASSPEAPSSTAPYGLRRVASRRAREAEERMRRELDAERRRAGTAPFKQGASDMPSKATNGSKTSDTRRRVHFLKRTQYLPPRMRRQRYPTAQSPIVPNLKKTLRIH